MKMEKKKAEKQKKKAEEKKPFVHKIQSRDRKAMLSIPLSRKKI